MNGKIMLMIVGLLASVCASVGWSATGKTAAFPLDLTEGDRASAGTEELTFSNLWDGDAEATVTIAQDGVAIEEGLTDEGVKTWTVNRNGRYVLTHTTYTNGAPGKVETAVFVVEGKDVPVGELSVVWEAGSYKYDNIGKTPGVTAKNGDQVLEKGVDYTVHYEGNTNAGTAKAILTGLPPYVGSVTNEFSIAKRVVELTSGTATKSYDGAPLVCHSVTTNGDGFVAGEGVDLAFTGSQTTVGSSKNTFDYTFKTGTLAGNYTITKTEGDLEVTRGEIVNPFDPDDPTNPATSEDLAKANCITNYDGDGHSVEVAAFLSPLIAANNPQITYSLLRDGIYAAQKPVFTNVVSTSVWYRIGADNFKPFTTNAVLTISPRAIANVTVAAIADQTYTGSGIEPIPAVTDMRMLIGMSEPTNILTHADYDLSYLNNTNVGAAKIVLTGKNNYEGSQTNTFQIVPAIIPPGPGGAIVATGYTNAYDGAAHGVSVSATGLKTQPAVQYKSCPSAEWQDVSPTYTDVCDTQVWWRVFAPNYQSVESTIGLKIIQAANAWTAEPAIEGWTYGETAKTPVGVAKFGEVTFVYSPAAVGAAGDYTMTASVAGTANYTGLATNLTFTIAKATMPPDDDPDPTDPSVDPEDPEQREDPTIQFSAFDHVGVYDGEWHTVDTNAIKAAYETVFGGSVTIGYMDDASGAAGVRALPPIVRDAGVTSFWYKVSSANYNDVIHPCKIAITNRLVTLMSGTKTDFVYDGQPHAYTNLTVTAGSFVAGEGIATSNWATVTEVTEGLVPNTFDYEPLEGTLLSNYDFTIITGMIAVVQAENAWTVEPAIDGWTYGETAKIPVGAAKFGEVAFVYSPMPVGAAGDYTMTASVAGTANYTGLTTNLNFTIAKASLPQDDDPDPIDPSIDPEDPEQREDPDVRFSAFDYVGVYDGEEHTVDTNAMKVAYETAFGESVTIGYVDDASGAAGVRALPPIVRDAGVTSFWYKVSSANYNDVIHPCKIAITNRAVTLTSASQEWTYDGAAHSAEVITVGGMGFVAGEGVTTNGFATITNVGTAPNAFAYAFASGTKAENYAVTCVTGTLTVVKAALPPGDDPDPIDPGVDPEDPEQREDPNVRFSAFDYVGVYDGDEHTIDTNALKAAYETALGESVIIGYMDDACGAAGVRALPPIVKDAAVTSFWYKVSSANYNDVVKPCKIAITNRAVTFTSATQEWIYDGAAHSAESITIGGMGFVAGEGVTTNGFATITNVGTAPNAFAYAFASGTKAENYVVTCVTGTLTVVKAALPPGDDPDPIDPSVDPEDPEQREDPDVRFSAFDYVGVYDGEAHTIDTNALKAAYETALGESVIIGYKDDASGAAGVRALPPIVRDVAVTSFWYKVSSANYNDVVKPCKIAITNRAVTLTSASQEWTYDGAAHSAEVITVGGMGFVAGEGVTTNGFATITNVGTAPNAFAYAFASGTKAENYVVTCVTGTLSVVKAALPPADDPDPIDPSIDPEDPEQREDPDVRFSVFDYVGVYDGEEHTVDTNAMKVAYETAFGESVTIGFMDDASGAAGVRALPPIVKDAVVTSFWYKVSSANYNDVIHPCKIAITNRLVTLMSGTKTDFVYDGQPHAFTNLTVTAGSFVAGEGVATSNWATVTAVAEGEVPNTFDYEPLDGTLLSNYDLTIVTGKIEVVQAENAWTVEPAIEGWTYGETAKTPVGAAKFGEVMFTYDPIPVGAAGDYTLTATVAGTANYTGLATNLNFTIAKAALPQGDDPDPIDPSVDPEDPAQREDPDVRFSAFDYVGVYDGDEHTIDTNALKAAHETVFGGSVTIGYMDDASGAAGVRALPPIVKDVVVTSFWYKVSSANYADIVKPCKVTITPRDLANVTVEAIGDQTHTGMSIEPTVNVTDGDPSLVTAQDYDIAYSDNVDVGEATVTLTGKRNYTGTKVAHFQIVGDSSAVISAQVAWTLLKASGTYLGQLKVTCTSGLAAGIDKLAFLFADRTSDGEIVAALWDTPHRAARSATATYDGEIYRFVTLDPSLITAENVPVTFGVSNLAATTIPVSERTIELYVRKRVDPTSGNAAMAGVDDFVGYVGWVSGGATNYLPVVAGPQAASLARASLVSAAPMRLSVINAALAVGTVVDAESSPYCKLVEFAVEGDEIAGRVEVGMVTDAGTESIGAIGDNATVSLLGTKTLKDGFAHLATVKTDDKGRFRIGKPEDCRFFKLKLTIGEVVE